MPADHRPTPPGFHRPASRPSRRTALRLWAGALAAAAMAPVVGPRTALATGGPLRPVVPAAADKPVQLALDGDGVRAKVRFDQRTGGLTLAALQAGETDWVGADPPPGDLLRLDGVQVDESNPVRIDGSGGLELLTRSATSLTLLHRDTGLKLVLEWSTQAGALIHRLKLVNARPSGGIYVGSAATLVLPLAAGDFAETLAADDAPNAWSVERSPLPASFGNHELRNAVGGVYPYVRLGNEDDSGLLVAVSTATAWRVDLERDGDRRWLRAGEYQSDLTLWPGEEADLPTVVTVPYEGGSDGAIAALHRYLRAVSLPPPSGWASTPPAIFNTWFPYGTDLFDDGGRDTTLRVAARQAADAGLEVFVVDAGWYLGNPIPNDVGDRGQGRSVGARYQVGVTDDDNDNVAPGGYGLTADEFNLGLGTWVENPDKWQAHGGRSGLRGFSDYVHSLTVKRPDGSSAGKLKFGLWVEPERFDPSLGRSKRVPSAWALYGTPILDFSRPEVVDGISEKIQHAINVYKVDYLKVDANLDLIYDGEVGRTGHFWTRWSAGFEQLLANLREANPGLYVEHCASGLKRYWIGVARLAHSTWLDDDVDGDNVGHLLDAADFLMLPRQKTVLVTEDLADRGADQVPDLFARYWGTERQNGGTLGLSSRIERWGGAEQRAAALAIETWKREVRGNLA